MSRPPTRIVARLACAAAVLVALRAWALPAWRRFAEQDAREAELHAG
jgi:hypothetical protein